MELKVYSVLRHIWLSRFETQPKGPLQLYVAHTLKGFLLLMIYPALPLIYYTAFIPKVLVYQVMQDFNRHHYVITQCMNYNALSAQGPFSPHHLVGRTRQVGSALLTAR